MISIGDRLDATYLTTWRLGRGGFGEVFLAEDEAIPGRYVALKALSGPPAAAEDNLIWEMLALSQLNHPGVVAFHHHAGMAHQTVPASCAGWRRCQPIPCLQPGRGH